MSIKYRKVPRKVLNGPDRDMIKTYAVAKASYYCDLTKLSELVANRTAMSDSEVEGMIRALIWVINIEMRSGAIVELGKLGKLRYTLRSEGVEDPDDLKAHHIKGVRIIFTPGVLLKDSASRVKFEQDEVKVEKEPCNEEHVP